MKKLLYQDWKIFYREPLWVMYTDFVSLCREDPIYRKIKWNHRYHFDDFCRLMYQTS